MRIFLFAIGLLAAVSATARHPNYPHSQNMLAHAHADGGQSPYTGLQTRAIKALSEEEISDLRNGKGMSLALAAELNGYPGPSHVMEMAEALGLSTHQLFQTERLYKEMQTEAKVIGEQLISREAELDRLFKDRKVTLAAVEYATARAAQAEGQLRAAHLKYHLSMAEILTPGQTAKYNRIRGYQ